ncbi:MAG: phytanoyl-CoA dioxygenase family protein [bacterium]|nr:phytanoyl-CoA dioxygenase family protein [bacterium]
MLTPEQRTEFEERGLIRLRGAVDAAAVGRLCERIWKLVGEREGLGATMRGSGVRIAAKTVKPLKRDGEFDLIYCPAVRVVADQLLGVDRWFKMPISMSLLMTMPGAGPWALSHKSWHLDYPCPGGVRVLPGLQPFLFLDRVEPHGGGTLAVLGSHRLVAKIQQENGPDFSGRSAEMRKLLQGRVPWLRALWSLRPGEDREARFMCEGETFDGVPLQVAEMTGEPGDVVLAHPWLFHALAPNCGERARMVLTDRLQVYSHPNSIYHRVLEERERKKRSGSDG